MKKLWLHLDKCTTSKTLKKSLDRNQPLCRKRGYIVPTTLDILRLALSQIINENWRKHGIMPQPQLSTFLCNSGVSIPWILKSTYSIWNHRILNAVCVITFITKTSTRYPRMIKRSDFSSCISLHKIQVLKVRLLVLQREEYTTRNSLRFLCLWQLLIKHTALNKCY